MSHRFYKFNWIITFGNFSQTGGDMKAVFNRFCEGVNQVEKIIEVGKIFFKYYQSHHQYKKCSVFGQFLGEWLGIPEIRQPGLYSHLPLQLWKRVKMWCARETTEPQQKPKIRRNSGQTEVISSLLVQWCT